MMTRARAAALLFGGTALGAFATPARAQTTMTSLKIPIQPTENAMNVAYGKDMGFFAVAGLDVDVEIIQNSSAIVAAVVSGSYPIGYGSIDTLAAIHQKSVALTVLAPSAEYVAPGSDHLQAILVPVNSTLQKAKDLNGKTVAVPTLHSLSETVVRAWADKNGGDSSTIKFVEIPFPTIPAALEANRVDAGYVLEPFLGSALKTTRVLAYPFSAVASHCLIGSFFTTPQWANDHRDIVSRFITVMRNTSRWANANHDKSAAILAKYTQTDPTVIATMGRVHYGDTLTAALMQPLIDVSAKYNGFSTFPAQELIYRPG
jgi:NitT/TauT family transport system substrate-binding protein